jgi:hypothetical protein
MNYVEVFGDEAIYRFATWCFWDYRVCAKGQGELASVEKGTVFASGNDVLVITETAASGKTRCLCFGGVGGIAWTDRRWTGVGVMQRRQYFVVGHAFQLSKWRGLVFSGRSRWGVFESEKFLDELISIKILQAD